MDAAPLPDTRGRRFKLSLPGDDASVLTLDLPPELTPVGPRGDRLGPVTSSCAGMRGWAFHGRPGQVDLQLTDAPPAPGAPASQDSLLIWVSGPTRIDLGAPDHRGGKLANWVTDWSVQVDPRGALQFGAELDPELELVAVSGPNVKEYQAQRQGSRTLVKVSLSGEPGPAAQVRFEAHAHVPLEGPWSVPAIRPLDAIWTGGTTTVILDESHVVEECRERSGRQVPAPPAWRRTRLLWCSRPGHLDRSRIWSSANHGTRSLAWFGGVCSSVSRRLNWSAASWDWGVGARGQSCRSICLPPGLPIGCNGAGWMSPWPGTRESGRWRRHAAHSSHPHRQVSAHPHADRGRDFFRAGWPRAARPSSGPAIGRHRQ